MAPEVAAWVRHYGSGYFTPAFWQARLEELDYWVDPNSHDYPHQEAMRQALRYLLSKPGLQTKLF